MGKRNLSQAVSTAADKFFTSNNEPMNESNITNNNNNNNDTSITNSTNIIQQDNVSNNTKHTHITQPTNKSKHYDSRGKRSERYGILLDKQLKEDLQLLCNATNNKSLNDFIVTILLNHVETPENQKKLAAYKELLKS